MSFAEAIKSFLTACPGPPLGQAGLHMAALQAVKGISELDPKGSAASERGESDAGSYLWSARQIGDRLNCSAEYLTRAAGKRGYSFAKALRWIRFLHAMALLAEECRVETVAYRLGLRRHCGLEPIHETAGGTKPEATAGGAPGDLGTQGGGRRVFRGSGEP